MAKEGVGFYGRQGWSGEDGVWQWDSRTSPNRGNRGKLQVEEEEFERRYQCERKLEANVGWLTEERWWWRRQRGEGSKVNARRRARCNLERRERDFICNRDSSLHFRAILHTESIAMVHAQSRSLFWKKSLSS